MGIEVVFGSVDKVGSRYRVPLHGRSTAMPEQSRCVNFVVIGQRRNQFLPDPARARRRMQQNQGRSLGGHGQVLHNNEVKISASAV